MLPICKEKNDLYRYSLYEEKMNKLKIALNTIGWDGRWYRRAFFDDGTPLRFN